MLLTIYIALVLSLHAMGCYFFDVFSPRIPFGPLLVVSAVAAYFLIRKSFTERLWPSLAVFVAAFIYFAWPVLPQFLPTSLEWDGANHLAIANFISDHGSHRQMVTEQYHLYWGGQLWSYPWGFHAFLAAVSGLTRQNVFLFVQPVILFFVSLIIGAVFSYLIACRLKWAACLAGAGLLVVSKYTFFYALVYSYWTQLAGIFFVFAIIYFSEMMPKKNMTAAVILLAGLAVIYPLYALPAWGAFFIHALFKKTYSKKELFVIAASAGVLSLALNWPMLTENLARLEKGGPRLWPAAMNLKWGVAILTSLFLLPTSLYFAWHRRWFYPIFPAVFFLFICMAKATHLSQYWFAKYAFFTMMLLIPVFVFVMDAAMSFISKVARVRLVSSVFCLALAVAAFFCYPITNLSSLKPSLSLEEVKLRLWMARFLPQTQVYYISDIYKLAVYEALSDKPKIMALERFKETARQGKIDSARNASAFLRLYEPLFKSGDYLVFDRRELSQIPNHFKSVREEGSFLLAQYDPTA